MAAEAPALFRVGREPDPFQAWTPGENKNHGNRFDDPRGEFGVLYAAEARRVAFMETLARFRPDLPTLAALAEMENGDAGDDTPQESGVIVNDWHLKRAIGTLRMMPGQYHLDITEVETREMLRAELAPVFVAAGLDDFDLGDALTRVREVTQPIARWAYEHGYHHPLPEPLQRRHLLGDLRRRPVRGDRYRIDRPHR